MFSELFQDSAYHFHIWLAWIFDVDQNIIQIHHNEDIKLFSEDLVDVALKAGRCIRIAKEHYLVLKVAVSGAEGYLPLIILSDSYPIVGTSQVQLYELFGPA